MDACGNQSNLVSQTITVIDNTPPAINCSSNKTVDCYIPANQVSFDQPTVLDECDANPVIVIVSTTSVTNADGSISYTRTWEATDACGNANRCQQTVIVPAPYNPTITPGGSTNICSGGSVQLCAPAGNFYSWNSGETTQCISASVAGTFTVDVTNSSGCHGSASIGVTVVPCLSCLITGDTVICQGQSTQLCAPAGFTSYHWSNGSTAQCITVTCGGCYCVTVTDASGFTSQCCVHVTVIPAPSCCISGNTRICQGQSTTLCAPAGSSSYLWSNGATTRCITVSSAGTYSVTVTNCHGCSSTCSATVTVNPMPVCSISGNTSICQGQSTSLCAPSGYSNYHWNNGANTRCITVSCAGTYSVTVSNCNGCSSTCSISVTVTPAPGCTISGNSSICQGQSTSLCAPSGGSAYLWNTGATTRCITVTGAGTYSVTVTNSNGCSSTCSKCVTVSPGPDCTISGNSSICQGQSTSLCVPSGGSSYLWNTGATTRCITVTSAGTYSVTVTNSSGCSSTCSKCVTVSTPPSSSISGNTSICQGQSTSLCASSGGASYHWNNGATSRCITVTCTGTYSVTVTNAAGCSSTSSVCVTLSSPPSSTITGNTSICHGNSTSLCAPAGNAGYLWNNGATTRCITVTSAGTYSVTVTNTAGCSSTSSICVTFSSPPSSAITGNTSICHGSSTSLCAPAGCASYLWSNGATSRCITVTCAGTYSVTVTNASGCSSTSSVCVTISSGPYSTISGNTHIAHGQSTYLCAPSGCVSYLWNTGATTRCITVTCAGTYSVTVTNAAGCSSTSSVCVTLINNHHGGCDSKVISVPVSDSFESTAYPNPFKATTTIQFRNTGDKTKTVVEIYGLSGNKIIELFNGDVESNGTFKIDWNAEDLPNGLYMYRIISGAKVSTGRLMLDK
ncbi:MAG: T9SS type A sorting domain-containing protein [Bacteroidetes bacterium]|nr:T9SS type A sorting domain-containing protein [Bacteroidota bacterium]